MTCYICGSQDFYAFSKFSELPRVTSDAKPFPKGGNLYACRQCGHVQKRINSVFQDELKEIYGNYSSFHQSRNDTQTIYIGDKQISRCKFLIDCIENVLNFEGIDSILDFGCGAGSFLTEIHNIKPNIDLYAFDLDNKSLPKLSGLKSFKKFYVDAPKNIDRKFSLITLVHSLEHIPDPIEILSFIKEELLEENGILFIQVPNCEENYFDLLIADHLSHFTKDSLSNLTLKCGYTKINEKTDWIKKELSFLLKKDSKKISTITPYFTFSEKIEKYIDSFQNIIASAKEIKDSENFGIFGTSITSTWLMGALKEKGKFFVDEDKYRIGGIHMNKPIYAPEDAPKGSLVYAPFYLPICKKLYEKSITNNWSFNLLFPYEQERI